DMEVWQLARALENKIFALTTPDQFHKDFDLIRQMRRSTGSIMDNIAEGFGRSSRLEFINSLGIAKGEANEIQSQLYRSCDRGYISTETKDALYQDIDLLIRKLASFMKYLNSADIKGQKFIHRRTPT